MKKLTDLVQIKTVNIERIGKIDVPVTLATDREIRNDAGLSADVILEFIQRRNSVITRAFQRYFRRVRFPIRGLQGRERALVRFVARV